jgi:hypothetical protein
MNEFELRWKLGAAAARRATTPASEAAPFGFATRVIAEWPSRAEPSLALLWQRLGLRILGIMALVLLTLVAYGALTMNHESPLDPPVENGVADSFWLL